MIKDAVLFDEKCIHSFVYFRALSLTYPDLRLIFRTSVAFRPCCPGICPFFRTTGEYDSARLSREELGEYVFLELQDAPQLLSCGVILEPQMSGALNPLLRSEQDYVTDAILAANVRYGHGIHFVIRQEDGILQTFGYLTECLCISGECVEVAAWISE